MKKLSIVTINYNNASDLLRTFNSVFEQTWQEFEYIIVDGGSTDGSVDIIKQHKTKFSYWISEPDKGIFNAMNKGIQKAKGEYLLMLNAGDLLYDSETLHNVFGEETYTEEILYGNAVLESKGKIFGNKVFSHPITFDFFRRTSLSHQATFIKRELHNKVGLYDEDLKFSSDWKFFVLAFCKYNVSTKFIDIPIAVCNCDGLTWNPKNFPSMKAETSEVIHKFFPAFIDDYNNLDILREKTNIFNTTIKHLKYRIIRLKIKVKSIKEYLIKIPQEA